MGNASAVPLRRRRPGLAIARSYSSNECLLIVTHASSLSRTRSSSSSSVDVSVSASARALEHAARK